jgi:hypothetical protein
MELYMKTYVDAYVEAYTETCKETCMDAAMPQMDKLGILAWDDVTDMRSTTSGSGSSHDDDLEDLQEISCPTDGDKVFLTSDANQDSVKNRFLESCPEVRDVAVVVLANDTDEFLVLMDEIRTPKSDPGAQATWDYDDSKILGILEYDDI